MLHDVVAVEVVDDYELELVFDDGTRGRIDLSRILSGRIFGPLRDPAYFRQVVVDPDLGTVVWPNGADLAPDALYEEIIGGRRLGED
jgi:hypothetical protein